VPSSSARPSRRTAEVADQAGRPARRRKDVGLGVRVRYDGQQTFAYLASRGVKVVRIPFRWERIQPELGGPLDRDELARLRAVVGRAHRAGLQVVLDLHNFGAYYWFDGQRGVRQPLGSSQLPGDRLVDVWVRLGAAFRHHPGVLAYSIMNEPNRLPPGAGGLSPAQAWERSSQAVVEALRRHGDEKTIAVPGYDWSRVRGWSDRHPRAWIRDPAKNFVYEAHHYFDQHHSGEYPLSYAEELAHAESSGDGG
jgi:aryl-phospho-beta-D-glucosidase BglC (GH1 family)